MRSCLGKRVMTLPKQAQCLMWHVYPTPLEGPSCGKTARFRLQQAWRAKWVGAGRLAMFLGPPRLLRSLLSLSCRAGQLPRVGCIASSEEAAACTAAVQHCSSGAVNCSCSVLVLLNNLLV